MKSFLALAICGFAGLTSAAPVPLGARQMNLLANGSFEDAPEDAVNKPLDKGSSALKGWVVTRGQIDVNTQTGDQWKPAHGKRSLDLHGSPGYGGVEQSIQTTPGKKYRVTFMMSGNPGVEHDKVQLGVRAADQSKEFEISMTGRTYEDLKWEEKSWVFTAKEKKTTVELHTAMPSSSNPFGGPLLDDVKVFEVE